METDKYWTGIADVTSNNLTKNVKGAVYRVLTFAEDYEAFYRKVETTLRISGDTLVFMEEPEVLADFLKHSWLDKEHEIYGMMKASEKNNQDVVCGEVEYYTFDDV